MDLQEIILGAEVSKMSFSQADDLGLFYALQDHRFSLDSLSKLNELFTKTGNKSRFCSPCKDTLVYLNTLKIT